VYFLIQLCSTKLSCILLSLVFKFCIAVCLQYHSGLLALYWVHAANTSAWALTLTISEQLGTHLLSNTSPYIGLLDLTLCYTFMFVLYWVNYRYEAVTERFGAFVWLCLLLARTGFFGWRPQSAGVPCANDVKRRNPLKFVGVPQTPELISAASGPKFTILRGHLEDILLLNKFFSDCPYMPSLRRYSPTKLCDGAQVTIFGDFVALLWPPYVIGGPLYFCPVISIYLLSIFLSFFIPRLISAAADWMSTILLHMVWP